MALKDAPHQTGRVMVNVCFLTPERTVVRPARLPVGASVERAIHASGILPMCPEIDLTKNKIGIYGKIVAKTAKLRDGDRVEIYTPARASGKNARTLKPTLNKG